MSWKDKLRKASFRGVPFYIEKSEIKVGRKVYMWTAWGRDDPWFQDAGEAPFEMQIDGYIIQNSDNNFDYMKDRDALIDALTTGKDRVSFTYKQKAASAKPGKLVHPFYGEFDVILKEPASIEETVKEGGMAKFSMVFVKWKNDPYAIIKTNPIDKVTNSVTSAINNIQDNFSLTINLGLDYVNSLSNVIKAPIKAMISGLGTIRGAVSSTLSTAINTCNSVLDSVDNVLNDPCEIAGVALSGVESILTVTGMAGDIVQSGVVGGCSGTVQENSVILDGTSIPNVLCRSCVKALIDTSQYSDTSVVPPSQEENKDIIEDMAKSMMLAVACDIAIRGVYNSQDEAFSTMEDIVDAMDSHLYIIGGRGFDNSTIYTSLDELRKTFTEAMRNKISSNAKEILYKVSPYGENTLMIAYNRFEDLSRCPEVFLANRSYGHPAFLTGGDYIKILSDEGNQ